MPVTTTGTFNWNPTAGELVLKAFSRCGVRPTELTMTHLQIGEMALNFIQVEISNLQPNLWTNQLKTIPLGAGIKTYSLPMEIVQIRDLYIRTGDGTTSPIDRYATPLSTTEYASLSNKEQQGFPSQYYFERTARPVITFYFVPDSNGPYVARYYSVRQTQDAQLSSGDTVDVPYRFLQAYICGVAWLLSKSYAPQMTQDLLAD